ncbi:hypothetical protein [Maritimibacter dapengensis]|uniref:Uncharacterized protein n=1 Tax=Maritimibacter dapengensis TaxID=2836868 RepID=A0ABS6SXC5_9RHOB|nr:hypothetical protein [Maritimibacter dapengensis]MBV7377618.1 hypothetical protein [Maritimibacter dapengensis]
MTHGTKKALVRMIGLIAGAGALPAFALSLAPVAPGPALISVEAGALVLEFSNACRADAGVRLTHLRDGAGENFLVVETAPTLQACPEIYQPVRVAFVLPDGLAITEDRVIARRPAEGQPAGDLVGRVDAEVLSRVLPAIGWQDDRTGRIGLSDTCTEGDIEARLLPEAVAPTGEARGYVALTAECHDPERSREFTLDADRPGAMLNPVAE